MPGADTTKLALFSGVFRGELPGTWWTKWNQNFDNLEARLTKGGVATPVGTELGHYAGQLYVRPSGEPDIYWCTAPGTPGTWKGLYHTAMQRRGGRGYVYQALASALGVVAPDVALGNYIKFTLTENTTISNPTNLQGGEVVVVEITDDAVHHTVSWGSAYKGVVSGATLTTQLVNNRVTYAFLVASNGDLLLLTPAQLYKGGGRLLANQALATTAATFLNQCSGFSFANVGANGVRQFMAHGQVQFSHLAVGAIAPVPTVTLNLHKGQLNSVSDLPIWSCKIDLIGSATTVYNIPLPGFAFAPNDAEFMGLSVQCSSSAFTLTYLGTGGGGGTKTFLDIIAL